MKTSHARTLTLLVFVVIAFTILLSGCASKGLGTFGAEMGAKSLPVIGTQRIPYTDSIKYFGYVKPGAPPDEEREGKKFFYLYVWIPLAAPELGVRMMSPVGDLAAPEEGDIISPLWEEGSQDTENFFDTYIVFERAATILSAEEIPEKIGSTDWIKYDYNDDSSEMPVNPNGSRYNSLVRLVSEVSNPLKALVMGLYRIGFTTFKRGEVQGTFYAEVGAPIAIPGVVIAKDIDSLMAGIQGE